MPSDLERVEQAPATRPTTIAEVIGSLDAQREQLVAQGDYENLTRAGVQLRDWIADLRTLQDTLLLDLAILADGAGVQNGGKTTLEVPGVGAVTVQGSYSHKNWDSAKLLRLVVEHVVGLWVNGLVFEDAAVLELPDLIDSLCEELGEVLPLTGSLQWRITELDRRGIDADDYHDKTPNPRKARLPK